MDLVELMVLLEFVLLPDGCGFWVMMVTKDERNVVCWLFCPVLTTEDSIVEVMTTGLELAPLPDAETELPVELLD